MTFTERSPLSEMKSLVKRLGVTDAGADYDLSKQSFLVYVPEKYDPATPMGLIVLLNYKASTELPDPVLPQLAEANCALVVPKDNGQPAWAKAGIALDVAHVMIQRYKIDPRRVYVFGFDLEWVGQRVTLNFPEVFTGGFWMQFAIYRPVQSSNGGFYNPKFAKPDPKALGVAKNHPFVIGLFEHSDQWDRWSKSFLQDGFKLIKIIVVDKEQIHYPNYRTDWLPEVLKYLDDGTAKLKQPATKPAATTRPGVTKPATRPVR
jgi:hypothetical protein